MHVFFFFFNFPIDTSTFWFCDFSILCLNKLRRYILTPKISTRMDGVKLVHTVRLGPQLYTKLRKPNHSIGKQRFRKSCTVTDPASMRNRPLICLRDEFEQASLALIWWLPYIERSNAYRHFAKRIILIYARHKFFASMILALRDSRRARNATRLVT